MSEKSGRVPRTRVPEVVKDQPNSFSRESQLKRLQEWDIFITKLDTSPGLTLKERWEKIDRDFISERNKKIGWKR